VLLTAEQEVNLMGAEHTEEFPEARVSRNLPVSEGGRNSKVARNDAASDDATRNETSLNDATRHVATDTRNEDSRNETASSDSARDKEHEPPVKEVSMTKVGMQSRLPTLDDDADVGVQKEHVVTRDGKADLRFTGVLLASAAPASAPKGHWQEYRIYQTTGGKYVFSKVTRTVFEGEDDAHEAEVFDPSPSSVPSQLIRSAREIAQARPMTWMDAAVAFFGYDPLAKALYRKLSVRFDEHVS
jgi:hypothetical protein